VKKILTYVQNRKGITIVWVALILFVLIMFLGMGVDLAYMYVAKNHFATWSMLRSASIFTGNEEG
jgi:hypothetical protein